MRERSRGRSGQRSRTGIGRQAGKAGEIEEEEEQFLSGATPGEFDKSNADQAEQETVPRQGGGLWVRGRGKGCIH